MKKQEQRTSRYERALDFYAVSATLRRKVNKEKINITAMADGGCGIAREEKKIIEESLK